MASLRTLALAVLRDDLPAYGLIAGDVGTVVFVHGDGRAYEIEFVTADGRTGALERKHAAVCGGPHLGGAQSWRVAAGWPREDNAG